MPSTGLLTTSYMISTYHKMHFIAYTSFLQLYIIADQQVIQEKMKKTDIHTSIMNWSRILPPPAASDSQVLVSSPHLLSTPSFFDCPLASVHHSHRPRLHVRPNRVQEEVREVDGASRLQKSPRHLTGLRPRETLQKIDSLRKRLSTISCSRTLLVKADRTSKSFSQ